MPFFKLENEYCLYELRGQSEGKYEPGIYLASPNLAGGEFFGPFDSLEEANRMHDDCIVWGYEVAYLGEDTGDSS